MKIFTRKDKRTNLEKEIDRGLEHAKYAILSGDIEQYERLTSSVETLCKAKSYETPRKVSPDTKATVGLGLAQVVLILFWEQGHVIASKAWSHVHKGRI